MSSRGKRTRRRFSFGQLRITRGALYLLFAELGLSLVYLLSEDSAKEALESWLTANANQVFHEYKVWTLVTTAVLEQQFISLIFHAFLLWAFVPTLERWWGTKKLLLFALWTSLAGAVAGTALGFALGGPYLVAPVEGLDAFIFGSIVAFGILYANSPVQFFGVLPMTGRQLMIGIIAFVGLFIVLGQEWVAGISYAAAMVLAWLLASGKWNPRLWHLRWKHKRARSKLVLVRDDKPKKWIN